MRYALFTSLTVISFATLAGCTTAVDDLGTVNEELSLVECAADLPCDRGEVCLPSTDPARRGGFCSTGDRCTDSRDCSEGSVCRGGDGLHCMVVERDRERPDVCPRGSVPGLVLCAPGFDNVTVSRDPVCETCEPSFDAAERCRAAGLTPARCRALMGGGDEPTPIARRCAAAGISPERCRALVSDEHDGRPTMERCRAAGIPHDRCRALVTGEEEAARHDRCVDAGIDPARCRALLADDPARDEDPARDGARDEDPARDGARDEDPARDGEPGRDGSDGGRR